MSWRQDDDPMDYYSAGLAARRAQERMWGVTMRDCAQYVDPENDGAHPGGVGVARRLVTANRPERWKAWLKRRAEYNRRAHHKRKATP